MAYHNLHGIAAAIACAQGPPPPPAGGQIKPGAADLINAVVYADNWFLLYINGKPVAVDPIDFLPHNQNRHDVGVEQESTHLGRVGDWRRISRTSLLAKAALL